MSQVDEARPLLAALVRSGEGQRQAVAINDFIFMAQDISNAYLVRTDDGDVLVNTGFMDNAERTKALLAQARRGELRTIILTQAHPDHYGGVPAFREPGSRIAAGQGFVETCRFYKDLMPFSMPRSRKLWGATIKRPANPIPPPEIQPDILVDRHFVFEQGGRRFELIATPGGETLDAIVVWMPSERVLFTGNLFGPVFLSMPNLCTIRGDKPRSVVRYLESLDRVRNLGADLLITGHGEPIRGAAKIRADLDRMYEAVSYVNQATIAGMNAGRDVHTLMREIMLPDHLRIGEFHGKVSWAVRTIWEEYAGWFHYDSTTSLYGVPRASVDADVAELAGGAARLAARARQHVDTGRPLQALHLLDIALGAEPGDREALAAKKAALEQLLAASGGSNLSETMWLKSEIAAVKEGQGSALDPSRESVLRTTGP
jgi:alkyl sulfatase BDS1-like metallo-beta-lactamase superfamily hydrolase